MHNVNKKLILMLIQTVSLSFGVLKEKKGKIIVETKKQIKEIVEGSRR